MFNEAGQLKDHSSLTVEGAKASNSTSVKRPVLDDMSKNMPGTTFVDLKLSGINEVNTRVSGNNSVDNEDTTRAIDHSRNMDEVSKKENSVGITLEQINNKWSEVLENVRKLKKSTHAFLLEGKPGRLEKDTLIIVFKKGFSFHRDKVDQAENRQTIQEVLQRLFGRTLTLRGIMEDEQLPVEQCGPDEELDRQALIKRTQDIFGTGMVVVKEDS